MKIHCTDIDSDLVQELYYEDELQVLQVRYPNGSWYQYNRVSNTEFDDLIRARSVGRHLNFHIKGDKESHDINPQSAGEFED